jgi:signal transduction histidine kinase
VIHPRVNQRQLDSNSTAVGFALFAAAFIAYEQLSPIHFGNLGARGAIETTSSLCALAAAVLVALQFRRTRSWRDLLLLTALLTVSLTDFTFSAVPAFTGSVTVTPSYDIRLVADVIVAVAFAAAALAPYDRRVDGWWPVTLIGITCVAALGLAGLLDVASGRGMAQAGLESAPGGATPYDSLWLWVTIGSAAIQFAAGVLFALRRGRPGDQAGLLAGVSFLLVAVRLQCLAITTVAADWVTPADGLRLLIYAVLVTVAFEEHTQARRMRERAALNAERTRIARDLHDGLAQDLAVILAQTRRLAIRLGDEHPLAIAARRALAISRGAISDLSASEASGAHAALREVADELESLHAVEVSVDVEDSASGGLESLAAGDREHLVRIVREAIVNAVTHGQARHIEVVLAGSGGHLLLRVSDDGTGIGDTARAFTGGFGLPAMRSRARALGGHLTARRCPTGGTDIEVSVVARQVL